MKKIVFTMLAGMMTLAMMAQGGTFTVKGTFEGREDSVAFMLVDAQTGKTLVEKTFAVTGEMLEMSYDLKDAAMLYVVDKNNGYKGHMTAPAIPGETVEFYRNAGSTNTRLRGSQFYQDYNEAEACVEAPLMDLGNFIGELRHKFASGVPEEQVNKEYEEKYPAYQQAYMNALTGYVKAHPDQEASAALIATIAETGSDSIIEDIEAVAALLTDRVQNSSAAALYKALLESAKKERKEVERQNDLEGNMAPEFTLDDINGEPLALSSLRGKWVIIDFWGAWCKWCIKGMPDMKDYYAKYGDKLEILGVDCNDTPEKWKAAVADNELPWLHVYNNKARDDEKNPLLLYAVRGFPTKVVIDPDGRVAKVIVGEDPSFYEYLDEVLK